MKIVHIMLNCFFVEGFSYQENILPKFHKIMGNDVYIISNQFAFDIHYRPIRREAGSYINNHGVKVTILQDKKLHFFEKIVSKFINYKRVSGLKDKLKEIEPDILFIHGGFFFDAPVIINYCKSNPKARLYIDHHADYYNSPVKSRLKSYLIGYYPRKLSYYAVKYWGTTNWRVQYLQDVYKISPLKTELLVMGGDNTLIDFKNQPIIRHEYRMKIGVTKKDFLVITGGKINLSKNIHLLIQAISNFSDPNIKLIVFGEPDEQVMKEILPYLEKEKIILVGWIKSEDAYNWFLASDLAVFPGTHSVLWEQALACGIPTVFKYWEGMTHVDVGGNCSFLYCDTVDEIKEVISKIVDSKELYLDMKKKSIEKAADTFSYERIAKQSIGM